MRAEAYRDTIEIYGPNGKLAVVNSSMVPPVGSKISIEKKVWEVISVTYAVDYAGEFGREKMRANVDVKPVSYIIAQ